MTQEALNKLEDALIQALADDNMERAYAIRHPRILPRTLI
jgi:hypothetical protein